MASTLSSEKKTSGKLDIKNEYSNLMLLILVVQVLENTTDNNRAGPASYRRAR